MKRTAIDFRPARGNERTELVYTALMHYTGSGKNSINASSLSVKAYKHYDPSEPDSITAIYDFRTCISSFVKEFMITSRKDIYNVIKNVPVDFDTALITPDEKHMSFSEDDPDAVALISKLNEVRFRDRGIILVKVIHQYLAHGNDEFYNKLSAYRMLEWLKCEYDNTRFLGDDRLELVINQICMNGISPEPKKLTDNEFRRFIGMDVNDEEEVAS